MFVDNSEVESYSGVSIGVSQAYPLGKGAKAFGLGISIVFE